MILGSLLLKREGLLYMVLCGGLFFIKMGYRGVRRRPGIPKKEKIIPLIMPIEHAEGI